MCRTNWPVVACTVFFSPETLIPAPFKLTFAEKSYVEIIIFQKVLGMKHYLYVPTINYYWFLLRNSHFSCGDQLLL